jgi:hypothetical protein
LQRGDVRLGAGRAVPAQNLRQFGDQVIVETDSAGGVDEIRRDGIERGGFVENAEHIALVGGCRR